MIDTLFFYPEYDQIVPRTIRIKNIRKQLSNFGIDSYILKYSGGEPSAKNVLELKSSKKYNFINKLHLRFFIRKLFPKLLKPDFNKIFLKSNINDVLKNIEKFRIKNVIIVIYPFSSFFFVKKIKEKFPNVNLILDIGDPLYSNSAREKDGKNDYYFQLENTALSFADSIIVTNNGTKQFYQDSHKVASNKISIIPQGVNLKLIKNSIQKGSEISNNHVSLIYSGIFYKKLRSPEELFLAVRNKPGIELDIYGSSYKRDFSNIHFRSRMEQKNLFIKMFNSKVLVFIDNAFGFQTSGKIYELLSFKKPILFIFSNPQSEVLALVKRFKNVYICENKQNDIAKTLKMIIDQSAWNLNVNYNINSFSWMARAEQYRTLMT